MQPHLDPRQEENLRALEQAILSLQDLDECRAFLQDLCTVQELIGLSQRLQVAKLLLAGKSYDAIRGELPVSSATITRISTALHYGAGGYQSVLHRQAQEEQPD